MQPIRVTVLLLMALPGCASNAPVDPPVQALQTGILARSTPASGSIAKAPVNQLQLHFVQPMRLLEVTVDGPDGLSPMMVSAAGETTDYSIPLPGLGAGAYRVVWKASATGQTSTGVIAFTVRD